MSHLEKNELTLPISGPEFTSLPIQGSNAKKVAPIIDDCGKAGGEGGIVPNLYFYQQNQLLGWPESEAFAPLECAIVYRSLREGPCRRRWIFYLQRRCGLARGSELRQH